MASFKFATSKKTYTIEGVDREYVIDVGNVDTMKQWREQIEIIAESASKLQLESASIDDLISVCKSTINMILDNDFDRLWEVCEHNVCAMLGLIADLGKLIAASQADIAKDYGL